MPGLCGAPLPPSLPALPGPASGGGRCAALCSELRGDGAADAGAEADSAARAAGGGLWACRLLAGMASGAACAGLLLVESGAAGALAVLAPDGAWRERMPRGRGRGRGTERKS